MRRALILGLLLTGCATVERAPTPAAAVATLPASFALEAGERQAIGLIPDLLPRTDPGFVALEQQAMRDAPTLAAAVARIDAARADLRGSRAERLPNIQGSAGAMRSRTNPGAQFGGNLPPGLGSPNLTTFDVGVDASFDADLFGRLRAGQRAATARLDAADADARAVRLALRSDIARAVTDYRASVAREAVIRGDIQSAKDLVSVTGIRARAGIAPEFDAVRARSLEADARARLQPIMTERSESIGRLVTLTALPGQAVIGLLGIAPLSAMTARPVLTIPAVLLRARPDVAAAERRLSAADQEIAVAAAERFPRLSITAALGLVALAVGDLLSDDAIIGSVGGGVAGPLLDFGRVAARIDRRQAEAREAFARYREALFQALGETEAALGAIDAADARVIALEAQASLDQDAAGLARERYRRGLDTFLTVIDAQRVSNASRSSAVEAVAAGSRARVNLYRAVGGYEPS